MKYIYLLISLCILLVIGVYLFNGQDTFQVQNKENVRDSVSFEDASLIQVIDGDTILVNVNDKNEMVRILGVDASEFNWETSQHECFATEARAILNIILSGNKELKLLADNTQGDRDIYERLLRYVILSDETDVGLELIRNGYAKEYTFVSPYTKQSQYIGAQEKARESGLGLWGKCLSL